MRYVPLRVLIGIGMAFAAAGALSACADDGRELAEPLKSQTTTTRPPPPTSAPDQSPSESGVTLTSPDFDPGGDIPVAATCAGANQFPNLNWTAVADDTVELALTLSDQTNPEEPLLLWLMAGIDPSESGVQQGTMPEGGFETLNDYGNLGWGSPCVEAFTNGYRDIQFRLYIMPQPSGLEAGAPGNEAWEQIGARAAESATLLARVEASSGG